MEIEPSSELDRFLDFQFTDTTQVHPQLCTVHRHLPLCRCIDCIHICSCFLRLAHSQHVEASIQPADSRVKFALEHIPLKPNFQDQGRRGSPNTTDRLQVQNAI
jgi:hypothetical protein